MTPAHSSPALMPVSIASSSARATRSPTDSGGLSRS